MIATASDQGPPPIPPYLPPAATSSAPGHQLLVGRRIHVVGGGQQDYGQGDPPAGIGLAIAVTCAREGAAIAISDVDHAAAERVAERVREIGRVGYALIGDAADEDDSARSARSAADKLDGLDGLVCNVGISAGDHLANTTVADWDRVLAVNARSHFLAIKHTLPLLPPGGSIVLVSSAAAALPSSMNQPAYAASKAALTGLALYVAREAANRRVRVNIVMPSLIDTPLGRLANAVKPDRAATVIPLGRQGTAWEVANATAFLLSDLASYTTGGTLIVDGGLLSVP